MLPGWSGAGAIESDGTNNYLKIESAGSGQRGAARDLGAVLGGSVSVDFDVWVLSTIQNTSIGLSEKSGLLATSWNDYAAYIGVQNGNLVARDGSSGVTLMTNAFAPSVVHNIQIVADTDAGTFDVFYDATQVATNLGFRNGPVIIDSFKVFTQGISGGLAPNSDTYVDNIDWDVSGGIVIDPFNITSISIAGGNATIIWNSQAGATYNILSKSALTDASWTTNKSGIASAGDGTTSDSVPAGSSVEFYAVEGQ
jgi:hypothetical protein